MKKYLKLVSLLILSTTLAYSSSLLYPMKSCVRSLSIYHKTYTDSIPIFVKRSFSYNRQTSTSQTYGITTYDALFKYVLDDPNIRPSFFNAVLPNLNIVSSERIDEHMNPLQEFQEIRDLFHDGVTSRMIKDIDGKTVNVHVQEDLHPAATAFLTKIIASFDDIKRAFPKPNYDGTMDFVCKIPNDEYVLVEMQVIPYDYWDKRALAYVAAFYGRQMKKGDQWKDIKKVIGINILGGGRDRLQHWKDSPDQFKRHYRIQEQLHQPTRYIDGIEIIQYSLMNAPEGIESRVLKDWITFFKDASHMTEADVEQRIQTPDVKEAFKRAKLSTLPDAVRERYLFEEGQYSHYTQHTQEQVSEAIAKREEELVAVHEAEKAQIAQKVEQKAKREMAFNLLKLGISDEMIIQASGLSQEDLAALKAEVS